MKVLCCDCKWGKMFSTYWMKDYSYRKYKPRCEYKEYGFEAPHNFIGYSKEVAIIKGKISDNNIGDCPHFKSRLFKRNKRESKISDNRFRFLCVGITSIAIIFVLSIILWFSK